MAIITGAVNLIFSGRLREIESAKCNPHVTQQKQFEYLIGEGRKTLFGQEHGFDNIRTQDNFRQAVPIRDYDETLPYIERMLRGESNILWPHPVHYFAKSSGTTSAKSKFIPVSRQGLRKAHMRGPIDIMISYCNLFPKSKVMNGRLLTLGGSKKLERESGKIFAGDLSAILIEHTPRFANWLRIPDKKTALITDFEEKVKKICETSIHKDIRSFTGVPSWNLVMMNRILEYTGKSNLLEIWPNMELFIHGGMDFRPYEPQFRNIIPSPDMRYMETYNASEGFFAIAEHPSDTSMQLMLDYGIYYEFLPLKHLSDHSKTVPLEGVRTGENYAMIITTCNGLWRYMIGDTVEFTSVDPYKIRITGRTKHYINAFGEEVIISNADDALFAACQATGAHVSEYTVAPVYMDGRENGAHEWILEFVREPDDLDAFAKALDKRLQEVNSDYEAKRFKSVTLHEPRITVVPQGTFVRWLSSRGMVGGQNKVPRLYNDRTYADQLSHFSDKGSTSNVRHFIK